MKISPKLTLCALINPASYYTTANEIFHFACFEVKHCRRLPRGVPRFKKYEDDLTRFIVKPKRTLPFGW